jgi:hypothetical protein
MSRKDGISRIPRDLASGFSWLIQHRSMKQTRLGFGMNNDWMNIGTITSNVKMNVNNRRVPKIDINDWAVKPEFCSRRTHNLESTSERLHATIKTQRVAAIAAFTPFRYHKTPICFKKGGELHTWLKNTSSWSVSTRYFIAFLIILRGGSTWFHIEWDRNCKKSTESPVTKQGFFLISHIISKRTYINEHKLIFSLHV